MPHTLPDYTTRYKMTKVFSNIDDAELAARLGSCDTYDRRGDIIWIDDFEAPVLKWNTTLSGVGAAVSINAQYPYRGDSHLKLVGGSTVSKYAQAYKYISYLNVSNLGVEVAFTADTDTKYFVLALNSYDGTNVVRSAVYVDPQLDDLSYLNDGGAPTVLDNNINFLEDDLMYHIVKIVIDPISHEYKRIMFDTTEYSMAGIATHFPLNPVAPCLSVALESWSQGAANAVCNCDSFILTQNE